LRSIKSLFTAPPEAESHRGALSRSSALRTRRTAGAAATALIVPRRRSRLANALLGLLLQTPHHLSRHREPPALHQLEHARHISHEELAYFSHHPAKINNKKKKSMKLHSIRLAQAHVYCIYHTPHVLSDVDDPGKGNAGDDDDVDAGGEEAGGAGDVGADEADEVDAGGEHERHHLGLRVVEPLAHQQHHDHERRHERRGVQVVEDHVPRPVLVPEHRVAGVVVLVVVLPEPAGRVQAGLVGHRRRDGGQHHQPPAHLPEPLLALRHRVVVVPRLQEEEALEPHAAHHLLCSGATAAGSAITVSLAVQRRRRHQHRDAALPRRTDLQGRVARSRVGHADGSTSLCFLDIDRTRHFNLGGLVWSSTYMHMFQDKRTVHVAYIYIYWVCAFL